MLHFSRDAENIPERNLDTYRWRGDLGLLDRLAYKSQEAIPRNWEMTSMDAARIEHYNQSSQLRIQSQSTNVTNLITEQTSPRLDEMANVYEASDTQFTSAKPAHGANDSEMRRSQEQKTKRQVTL